MYYECKEIPTLPEKQGYIAIEGIYERVHLVTTGEARLPEVYLEPTQIGVMWFITTQISDNKYEFKTSKIPINYPTGKVYEISVWDGKVWTEDRMRVGRNIYINGKLLKAVFVDDWDEIARFRIDENGVVYDAF